MGSSLLACRGWVSLEGFSARVLLFIRIQQWRLRLAALSTNGMHAAWMI
jgi:hypothetical protein